MRDRIEELRYAVAWLDDIGMIKMHTSAQQEVSSGVNGFVLLIAGLAAVAGILFGFDTGVISGAILFIRYEFHLTAAQNGLVVAAVLMGATLGSIVSGRFADYYGRRNLLIITAGIFLIGTLCSAFALSVPVLILSRVVVGLGIGIACYTAPLYISELAPPQWRGMLVSLNQLAITLGILLAYLVCAYFADSGNWRMMLGFGVVPAGILFLSMLFLPKSPRWLILVQEENLARETLKKIRSRTKVDQEILDIQQSIGGKSDWTLLFQKWIRPAIWIGLGLGFFQQCTGINTIIYYAPTIFETAGFHHHTTAILATLGVGGMNVAATIAVLPLLDRVGRKPLLYVGMTLMTISLLALSLAFALNPAFGLMRWVAMGSMVVFILGFAIGLGPVMWLMFAEIFPLEIRGLGTSLVVAMSWVFNGVVAWTFLPLVKWMGSSPTFLLYALLTLVGLLFVQRVVPETKNVSLEQIEQNLRAGCRSRDLGRSI